MSTIPRKVFIQVDSAEEQENIKNNRKTLKVLQKEATNKENLVGRSVLPDKYTFKKSKSETAVNICTSNSEPKRRKSSLSQDSAEKQLNKITEEDLTTDGEPSEGYWKVLAEKRRVALDISLKENEELHERVASLEEELNISRAMLDETKNLVEVLTEMVQETDANDSGFPQSVNAGLTINTTSDSDTLTDNDIEEDASSEITVIENIKSGANKEEEEEREANPKMD